MARSGRYGAAVGVVAALLLVACGGEAPTDEAATETEDVPTVEAEPAEANRSTRQDRDTEQDTEDPDEPNTTEEPTGEAAAASDGGDEVTGGESSSPTSTSEPERASSSPSTGDTTATGTTPSDDEPWMRSPPVVRPRPAPRPRPTLPKTTTPRPRSTTTQPRSTTTTQPRSTTTTQPRSTTTVPTVTTTTQPRTTTTTTQPRSTTTTTTTVPGSTFVPAGGENSFSVYLGGSEVPARCPGLRVDDQRHVYVGSTHNQQSVAGAELGWWINVCLSHDSQDRQRIGSPVTVTPPNGATFQISHSSGRDCSFYLVDDCDVLYDFRALPTDLGTWRLQVDLVDPPERIEHEFELRLPDTPSMIGLSSFLVTGTPGSQMRIAAVLGREDCSRFGEPPDEVCYNESDPHAEYEDWISVWVTEVEGPVIGADGTAWWTQPAIDWPPVPDPEPGLPYGGSTRVCYAIIFGGTLTDGLELGECVPW